MRSLDSDKVLFTPDKNLARWVADQVPEKEIVAYDGVCPTHDVLRYATVDRTRSEYPEAIIIAHPECREDVVAAAFGAILLEYMLEFLRSHRRYANMKVVVIGDAADVDHRHRLIVE